MQQLRNSQGVCTQTLKKKTGLDTALEQFDDAADIAQGFAKLYNNSFALESYEYTAIVHASNKIQYKNLRARAQAIGIEGIADNITDFVGDVVEKTKKAAAAVWAYLKALYKKIVTTISSFVSQHLNGIDANAKTIAAIANEVLREEREHLKFIALSDINYEFGRIEHQNVHSTFLTFIPVVDDFFEKTVSAAHNLSEAITQGFNNRIHTDRFEMVIGECFENLLSFYNFAVPAGTPVKDLRDQCGYTLNLGYGVYMRASDVKSVSTFSFTGYVSEYKGEIRKFKCSGGGVDAVKVPTAREMLNAAGAIEDVKNCWKKGYNIEKESERLKRLIEVGERHFNNEATADLARRALTGFVKLVISQNIEFLKAAGDIVDSYTVICTAGCPKKS